MIKVIIEIHPKGDESKKIVLGTMKISNDGTGTVEMGNYDYIMMGRKRELKRGKGRIENFPRLNYTAWHLLHRVLNTWAGEMEEKGV